MGASITTLSNGLRVVTDRMDSVETAAIGVWVAAGTRNETADVNGISHVLEHMAFKGTARRSAQTIAEEMDNVGGQLNAYTSRDHTAYFAKVLKEDQALAVDLLADILLNSTMDAEELTREQHVIVQEISQANDTPDDIIFDHFQAAAFPGQPLGWPVLGREEIVRAVTPESLKAYMAAHYAADTMIVSAAGAVDHDAFAAQVERAFAALPRTAAVNTVGARYEGGEYREDRPLEQTHVVLGFGGIPYGDPQYYDLAAMSVLLGEGMSSRLFQEIREKRGLAYAVFSATQSFADTGLISVYAGTAAEDVPKMMPVLCGEIRKIAEAVSEDEVRRARAQLKAGLLMSLESPGSRCTQHARQLHIYGRVLTAAEIIAKVEGITAAGITAAAARVFGGAPTVAALGGIAALEPLDAIRERLKG